MPMRMWDHRVGLTWIINIFVNNVEKDEVAVVGEVQYEIEDSH